MAKDHVAFGKVSYIGSMLKEKLIKIRMKNKNSIYIFVHCTFQICEIAEFGPLLDIILPFFLSGPSILHYDKHFTKTALNLDVKYKLPTLHFPNWHFSASFCQV